MLHRRPTPPDRSIAILRIVVIVLFTCTVTSMTIIGVMPYLGLHSTGTPYAEFTTSSPLLFLVALLLTAIILSAYRHPMAKGAWRLLAGAFLWLILVALSLPAIT